MLIALVRHGMTDWNLNNLIQGSEDVCLNSTGKLQAALAAERLVGLGLKKIYSSNLSRALETALIIGRRLSVEVAVCSGLQEQDLGLWQGMPLSVLVEQNGTVAPCAPDGVPIAPPLGETRDSFARRVLGCLGNITSAHCGDLIGLVTHQGVIKLVLGLVSKRTMSLPKGGKINNGGIHLLEMRCDFPKDYDFGDTGIPFSIEGFKYIGVL